MKKAIILIALCLLSLQAAHAQAARETKRLPEKLREAELRSINGGPPVILNTYTNRVAVVLIWAPWCGPCRFALEGVKTLYKEFAARGVEVIALWPGDEESADEEGRAIVREYQIEFPVARMDGELFKALTTRGYIPLIFIISGDGVILEQLTGWHQERTLGKTRAAVGRALTEPPPAP
jgi:thiol-disulfide isomerase/thioredoxin